MTIAHIDGDIICYAVGFAAEGEPLSHCLHSVKQMVEGIKENTKCEAVLIHLTGGENFRDKVATILPYKGNRTADKPAHYEEIRKYLFIKYPVAITNGIEADDSLGIAITSGGGVLCSIDKDLNMIVGDHYNWRTNTMYTIEREEADNNFIIQCLKGDNTDNIPGLFKITGNRCTKKIIEYCTESGITVQEKFSRVLRVYYEGATSTKIKHPIEPVTHLDQPKWDMVYDKVTEIATLLWIQTNPHRTWQSYIMGEEVGTSSNPCVEVELTTVLKSDPTPKPITTSDPSRIFPKLDTVGSTTSLESTGADYTKAQSS